MKLFRNIRYIFCGQFRSNIQQFCIGINSTMLLQGRGRNIAILSLGVQRLYPKIEAA